MPVKANGFQDRLVMTTSIILRAIQLFDSVVQNARKMQDGCSQKCELKCRNPNKIKGLENISVTEPTVFQDSCPSENIVEIRDE